MSLGLRSQYSRENSAQVPSGLETPIVSRNLTVTGPTDWELNQFCCSTLQYPRITCAAADSVVPIQVRILYVAYTPWREDDIYYSVKLQLGQH